MRRSDFLRLSSSEDIVSRGPVFIKVPRVMTTLLKDRVTYERVPNSRHVPYRVVFLSEVLSFEPRAFNLVS